MRMHACTNTKTTATAACRFFGRSGTAAPAIAAHALAAYPRWEQLIAEWQAPVLHNTALPRFYRYTLFNELYFLAEGGTLWLDSIDGTAHEPPMHPLGPIVVSPEPGKRTPGETGHYSNSDYSNLDSIGQFLYLEGHEYLMYNTYDVHFYASFALAQLWPALELSLQRDVAKSVFRSDGCMRTLLGEGDYRPRKVKGVVPHDVGAPSEEPWSKVIHNVLSVCIVECSMLLNV
jgi:non-lysosomal glucosylceramidase